MNHNGRIKAILSLAFMLFTLMIGTQPAHAGAFEEMMASYQAAGAGPFDPSRGQAMWRQQHTDGKTGQQRACATCHTQDLTQVGKHKKTGKRIDPLAPSANTKRLTEVKKIKKWFKRNCRWTLGRECTPQEQGDFLTYIKSM